MALSPAEKEQVSGKFSCGMCARPARGLREGVAGSGGRNRDELGLGPLFYVLKMQGKNMTPCTL